MSIHRICMRDHVRNAIVARIVDGTYPPGTRLKEMSVARALNVSQAPVREALRELAALGLVETEHYRGTRVRSIDLSELREAYELRAEIEDASARRAVPCASEDLAELEADLGAMQSAARAGDLERYMSNAVDFHRRIVRMSGNSLFLHAWEHMAWDIRARIAARRIGSIGVYDKDHAAVLTALRAGDGTRAGAILRRIMAELSRHLAEIQRAEAKAAEAAPPTEPARQRV
jgi:DNA-binding GntR family transcriptional regulator